jgi:hypothetical protein
MGGVSGQSVNGGFGRSAAFHDGPVLFEQIVDIAIYGISDNLANPFLGSGVISGVEHSSDLSVTKGCGGAVITGYAWAAEQDFDVVVRMDGDGQMNPEDLSALIDPVVAGAADFAKGNRFFSGKAYEVMPKLRFLGTAFLSLLTKIVSGYWHLSDFQSGYVAISKKKPWKLWTGSRCTKDTASPMIS